MPHAGMHGDEMASDIVDAMVTAGKYPGLSAAEITQLKDDLTVYCTAMITYFAANAVIKVTLNQSLNTIFAGGVPVATDGGAALQTAWISSTTGGVKDDSTGTIA